MKDNLLNALKQKTPILLLILVVSISIIGSFIFFSKEKEEKKDVKFILNYKRVNSAFEYMKFCKKNDSNACFQAAIYYLDGKNVKPNLKKATKYLLKACSLKNGKACFFIGKLWLETRNHHKPNPKKAKKYLLKACKLGIKQACEEFKKLK